MRTAATHGDVAATPGPAAGQRGLPGRGSWRKVAGRPSVTGGQDVIRPISHPDGTRFDCAEEQPSAIIAWLAGLHELRDPRRHQLLCETAAPGHQAVYVYRPAPDRYQVRHFPGSGHHGGHNVVPETDEHKRGKEYYFGEFDRHGIPALVEPATDNNCHPDVLAPAASRITAVEFQAFNRLQDRDYKARTTRLLHATSLTGKYARPLASGILPVWIHAFGMPSGWSYPAPSIAAQDTSWEVVPRPGSVTAIGVRSIEPEKCRIGSRWTSGCPAGRASWCGEIHPFAAPRGGLDTGEVMAMTTAGELIPIINHTGAVYLVSAKDAVLYNELGGNGTYGASAKARPMSVPMRGHPRSPHHDAAQPTIPAGDWRKGAFARQVSRISVQSRWRCTRCSALVDSDPCPQCGSARITWISRERSSGCPLCSSDHPGCHFAAGSLGCVAVDCPNPHHQEGRTA